MRCPKTREFVHLLDVLDLLERFEQGVAGLLRRLYL